MLVLLHAEIELRYLYLDLDVRSCKSVKPLSSTALASSRSRYASLFTDTVGTMRSFFAQPDSTANVIVLAELGRFPLCFHWWQQILRYHNRIDDLSDDERLIKCAFVEGMHDPAHLFWSHKVHNWLQVNLKV